MNRPTAHPAWDRGLPDFIEENSTTKRELLALAVLALGFVSGVLFMLI